MNYAALPCYVLTTASTANLYKDIDRTDLLKNFCMHYFTQKWA